VYGVATISRALLQKRRMILRSLLIVATPYRDVYRKMRHEMCIAMCIGVHNGIVKSQSSQSLKCAVLKETCHDHSRFRYEFSDEDGSCLFGMWQYFPPLCPNIGCSRLINSLRGSTWDVPGRIFLAAGISPKFGRNHLARGIVGAKIPDSAARPPKHAHKYPATHARSPCSVFSIDLPCADWTSLVCIYL